MIWSPFSENRRVFSAVRHRTCGKRIDLSAPWPLWGKCECGAAWSQRVFDSFGDVDLDARFEAGVRPGENATRRIWVETGNSLHGLYTEETDIDDREGTLRDGRRWWCYDHEHARTY